MPGSPFVDRPGAYYLACAQASPAGCCAAETSRAVGNEGYREGALEECRTACEAGDLDGCAGLGEILYRTEGSAAGEELLRPYCTPGNDIGCRWFETPFGTVGDEPQLIEAFRGACESGGASGCLMLGRTLDQAHAADEAETALRKACELHAPDGCAFLMRFLQRAERLDDAIDVARDSCRGDPPDLCAGLAAMLRDADRIDEATEVWRDSCDSGDGFMCEQLAKALAAAGRSEEALEAARRACETDQSCTQLATISATLGRWETFLAGFRDACTSGDPVGCLTLAFFLMDTPPGTGADRDELGEETAASFRRGCELGLPAACGMIGYVERDGDISDRGLRLDAEMFYRVYCAEGGNRRCQDRIETEFQNHGEALGERLVRLLRKDCDDGAPYACHLWGLFANAETVPASRFEAAFRRSCSAGIAGACRHLAYRLRGTERPVDAEEAETRACELDRTYCD